MPRRSASFSPPTLLAVALVSRRDGRKLAEVVAEAQVPSTTLSHLERGTHLPSADTALKLARWLGWSMEQVMEAAKAPASSEVETP